MKQGWALTLRLSFTLALHGLALLLALQSWPSRPAMPPPARSIQLSLIAAPAPQARQPKPPQIPKTLAPAQVAVASLSPAPLNPSPPMAAAALAPERTSSASAPAAPPATPPATPAAPPLVWQAASPPDRRCTELQMARHYPAMLRERGIEGQVLLRVRVDEQGQATEIVVQGGGSGWRLLDEAARLLTQACRFLPARRGEQTLASWVEYPVRFAVNLD